MQAKRVVWPDVIVFFMPDVDRNLGLFDAVEPLGIEELLTQDTVEAIRYSHSPKGYLDRFGSALRRPFLANPEGAERRTSHQSQNG